MIEVNLQEEQHHVVHFNKETNLFLRKKLERLHPQRATTLQELRREAEDERRAAYLQRYGIIADVPRNTKLEEYY